MILFNPSIFPQWQRLEWYQGFDLTVCDTTGVLLFIHSSSMIASSKWLIIFYLTGEKRAQMYPNSDVSSHQQQWAVCSGRAPL